MDQESLFKKHVNIFLLNHADKMLERALKVTNFEKDNYLLLQAFVLAEYDKEDIYFIKEKMRYRITRYFNEVMKYSYGIRKTTEFFSNEYLTRISEKFDFIKNMPDNYSMIFQKYQREIFEKYWNNIDTKKMIFFINILEQSKDKVQGEIYAKLLYYFLGDGYIYRKKSKNKVELIVNVDEKLDFFLEIDIKHIDVEFNRYSRFPPFPVFIDGGMLIDGHKFYFNKIDHPVIHGIAYHNDFFLLSYCHGDVEMALKWLFIQCDITAYYIKMCFDFYREGILKYIETYS